MTTRTHIVTVDARCYDLAAAFLEEIIGATEADIRALAQELQAECEAACQEVEARVGMRKRDECDEPAATIDPDAEFGAGKR